MKTPRKPRPSPRATAPSPRASERFECVAPVGANKHHHSLKIHGLRVAPPVATIASPLPGRKTHYQPISNLCPEGTAAKVATGGAQRNPWILDTQFSFPPGGAKLPKGHSCRDQKQTAMIQYVMDRVERMEIRAQTGLGPEGTAAKVATGGAQRNPWILDIQFSFPPRRRRASIGALAGIRNRPR